MMVVEKVLEKWLLMKCKLALCLREEQLMHFYVEKNAGRVS